jgi:hypothetical protein
MDGDVRMKKKIFNKKYVKKEDNVRELKLEEVSVVYRNKEEKILVRM